MFTPKYCNQEQQDKAEIKGKDLLRQDSQGRQAKSKKFYCTFEGCLKSYSRRQSRNLHIKSFHYGVGNFECEFQGCGKVFTEKGNLKVHQRTHTGERPFTCNYCGKIFTSVGNCRDHQRRHAQYKPYHCDYCDRSYYRKYQLKSHCSKKHIFDITQNNNIPSLRFQPENEKIHDHQPGILDSTTMTDDRQVELVSHTFDNLKQTREKNIQSQIDSLTNLELRTNSSQTDIKQEHQNLIAIPLNNGVTECDYPSQKTELTTMVDFTMSRNNRPFDIIDNYELDYSVSNNLEQNMVPLFGLFTQTDDIQCLDIFKPHSIDKITDTNCEIEFPTEGLQGFCLNSEKDKQYD